MRKNEYKSLSEFKSQYIGEWNPSEGKWLGLDFIYKSYDYRLQIGSMFEEKNTILEDGREAMFSLYKMTSPKDLKYELLGEYADMDDLLKTKVIDDSLFEEIIMADETELVGQD